MTGSPGTRPSGARSAAGREVLLASRRDQIVDAATVLLAHRAYSTVTVQDIASQAGMSVGNVYRYVKGKGDILWLIFDHLLSRYEAELPPIAAAPGEPTAKLWQAIRTYVDIIDDEPTKTLITYRESAQLDPPALEEVKRREQASNRPIEEIIEAGIAAGEFTSAAPSLTAYSIATLAHMWALKGWWLRSRMTAHDYAAQQYRMVLGALTTDPIEGVPLPSVMTTRAR